MQPFAEFVVLAMVTMRNDIPFTEGLIAEVYNAASHLWSSDQVSNGLRWAFVVLGSKVPNPLAPQGVFL